MYIYQAVEVNIMCFFSLQIDFLVNNAGILQLGLASESDLDVDLSVLNINVLGTISLTKAVLPHMVRSKSGQIVVLSSASGKCGKLNLSWVGLAKRAVWLSGSRFSCQASYFSFILV